MPLPSSLAPNTVALGMLAAMAPALLMLRRRPSQPFGLGLSGVLVILSLVPALSSFSGRADPSHQATLALLPLLTATGVLLRSPAARWLDALPAATGLALAAALGMHGPTPILLLATLALVALATAAQRTGATPWRLAAALAGAAAALSTGAGMAEGDVLWLGGTALTSLVLLGQLPVVMPQRQQPTVAWTTAALAHLALFPPLYVCWDTLLGDAWIGALPVLIGVSAGLAGAVLVRRGQLTADGALPGIFAIVTLAGLTAALPLQLEQTWLTVGLAAEGLALAWLTRHLRHPVVWWTSVALGVAVSVRLLLNPDALAYGSADGMVIFNWTLYTWGLPALALAGSSRLLAQTQIPSRGAAQGPAMLGVLAVLVGFALVNVEVSHAFRDAGPLALSSTGLAEGMVRSLSWGAYGMAVLGLGLWRDHRPLRLLGFGFLLLGAGRVFLVDLWSLSGFARVGSVLGLGASLLLAAFLFERLVMRGRSAPKDTP